MMKLGPTTANPARSAAGGEDGEELGAAGIQLHRGQVVAAGGAAVDDDHGYAGLGRAAYEAEPAHHGQRRADHEQGVVGAKDVDRVVAVLHAPGRDVLPEEHHVGLEHPTARLAVGDDEPGRVLEVDV